jgi:hypothetical protein
MLVEYLVFFFGLIILGRAKESMFKKARKEQMDKSPLLIEFR